MVELYEYDSIRLWVTILATLLTFSWIGKISILKVKLWYGMLAAFLLIYSGIGGAIKEVPPIYTFFYITYIGVLSITLRYYYRKSFVQDDGYYSESQLSQIVTNWVDRYGGRMIILYFILLLFDLVYPVFRLQLLLAPPSPSLEDLHYKTFVLGNTKDSVSQLVYLLQQFFAPFFYLSLFRYRNSFYKPLLLLLLPVYIDLCNRGIIGRGEAMIPLVVVVLVLFEKVNPRHRRFIILSSLIAIPFLSYIFVQFSFLRIGADFVNLSLSDSMQVLFSQEVGYPLHFSYYYEKTSPLSILEYLLWIVLLPLPGFLKFGYGDPQVNLKFTMLVTGLDPSQNAFSICLPGLVGESIIVFGVNFFPIHAIILGVIISKLAKYLSKSSSYSFLFFYVSTIFSYNICRGGTASAYSFAFKQFLIFLAFIYYLKKKNSIRS